MVDAVDTTSVDLTDKNYIRTLDATLENLI